MWIKCNIMNPKASELNICDPEIVTQVKLDFFKLYILYEVKKSH